MMRLLTLGFLLSGLTAWAQTSLVPEIALHRVEDPATDTYTFGPGACGDTITMRWSNTLTTNVASCSQNPFKLWASETDCADTPGTGDKRYDDVPAATVQGIRAGSWTLKLAELPGFANVPTDGGTQAVCGSTGLSKTHHICGNIEYTLFTGQFCGTTGTKLAAHSFKLVYDTLPPTAPTITSSAAEDKAVRINFEYDSDTSNVTVEVRESSDAGEGEYRQLNETVATNKLIRGSGLQNTVAYDVRIRAKDAAGNVSEPSDAVTITPIDTLGFFAYYQEKGGTDAGGCSTGLGLIPTLIGLWALRRARKQARSNS